MILEFYPLIQAIFKLNVSEEAQLLTPSMMISMSKRDNHLKVPICFCMRKWGKTTCN